MDFTALSDRQFTDFRDRISNLQSQAPANVQDDWAVLGSTLDKVKQLLNSAGVSFDDLRALRNHQTPSGSVNLARLQQIAPRLQALGSDSSLSTAKNSITKSAESACNISLH
jgi:hypothetical protein